MGKKKNTLAGDLVGKVGEYIIKYQSQIPADSSYQTKWDSIAILEYIKKNDLTIARTKDKLVQNSLDSAIKVLKGNPENLTFSDSEGEIEASIPIEQKESNFLNKSLHAVYSRSEIHQNNPIPDDKIDIQHSIPVIEDPLHELSIKPVTNTPKKRSRTSASTTQGSKKLKSSNSSIDPQPEQIWSTPTTRLSDLGGIDHCIEEVLQLIGMPLKHPEIYLHLGINPPRGILLHGPPGCGKTMLANAIAGEVGVPFITISAPSIVSGMSGESEKKIREVFDEAKELAPCLLFIDEIDAITPKRETAQREMERRIVAQLLTCMDDCSLEKTQNKPVLIIGATNRPDAIDPALRRAGRFDREISMGVPDEEGRRKILEKMCGKMKLGDEGDEGVDFLKLAKLSPGYVGADLGALTSEAGMIAVKRIFKSLNVVNSSSNDMVIDTVMDGIEQELFSPNNSNTIITEFLNSRKTPLSSSELSPLHVKFSDFIEALKIVQPSSKREGFATIPDVSWEDVGALTPIREELRMAIVEPIRNPKLFSKVGINSSCGVLLYGPPGCGKTLLAKAVSRESHCNFISVKGPELLNKYVGESERAIRQVFDRARASSPCIIFFDELDALCPNRSADSESQHSSRLVNTLLTEMDGMQGRKQVYVIAATNRPDMIDPAMLRPGRLDKALYVDLPTAPERLEILKTVSRKTPLSKTVDLKKIADHENCDGFSGADLASFIREAAVAALRRVLKDRVNIVQSEEIDEDMGIDVLVEMQDCLDAFAKISPSVSKKDRRRYELLKVRFGQGTE